MGSALVLLVIYLSLAPAPIELPIEKGDKFGHAIAYFVLMSWFANLFETLNHRRRFALGFVYLAVSLEFVQHSTGYRTFEIADMAAGTVGVVIGWLLAPPRLPNYLSFAERFWRGHV